MEDVWMSGLVLGVAPRGIESHDGRPPQLHDTNAMSAAGCPTPPTAVFVFGRMHPRPEFTKCGTIIEENLLYIPDERTHIGRIDGLPVRVAIVRFVVTQW
jgi:hypothetical protein